MVDAIAVMVFLELTVLGQDGGCKGFPGINSVRAGRWS